VPWLHDKFTWAVSEGKSLAYKETFKWIALWLATLIGGWLWAVARRLFDDEQPFASAPLWVRIKAIALDFYADPISYSVTLLRNDLGSTILALILLSGYAILFVLLRRGKRKLREASVERALAIQAGIGGRWPHAKIQNEGGAPWNDLCSEIARNDNGVLLILGANGVETFGRPGAPLYETMQQFRGLVRVILTDPDSPQTAGRAATVNVSMAEYKRAIAASVKRLRDLKHQQHSIEGRYYAGQPNWKLIITSRTCWLQYYAPGKHVDETPVWRFDTTEHGDGLYHLFAMEFERIWHRCEGSDMPF
jgi:hypothetical protein